MQTSSQRFVLVDTSDHPKDKLAANEIIDTILDHEIKELGVSCPVH